MPVSCITITDVGDSHLRGVALTHASCLRRFLLHTHPKTRLWSGPPRCHRPLGPAAKPGAPSSVAVCFWGCSCTVSFSVSYVPSGGLAIPSIISGRKARLMPLKGVLIGNKCVTGCCLVARQGEWLGALHPLSVLCEDCLPVWWVQQELPCTLSLPVSFGRCSENLETEYF